MSEAISSASKINAIPAAPSTAAPKENILDLIPPSVGFAVLAGIVLVPSGVLTGIVAATTAIATIIGGGSLAPAGAAATLAGTEWMTGLPVTRTAFALGGGLMGGVAAGAAVKLICGGVHAVERSWALAKAVFSGVRSVAKAIVTASQTIYEGFVAGGKNLLARAKPAAKVTGAREWVGKIAPAPHAFPA